MIPDRSSLSGTVSFLGVSVHLGGKRVLQDVDLEIAQGERVAFIGPSGAGKTTLLRLLNGMVFPQKGQVLVEGQDPHQLRGGNLRRLRHRIGFVHQDLRLVGNLRVSQNVLCGLLGRQNLLTSLFMFLRPRSYQLDRVHDLLSRVGIPDKIFQRTDKLSGGEAQRVAVARALMQDPTLLAADEPVASVDPARAREVLSLLGELSSELGLTLCVSLHDPQLVREFFQRVVGLRRGRVVLDVPVSALHPDQLAEIYALEEPDGL